MEREEGFPEKGPMKRERPWRGRGDGPNSKRPPGGPMPSTLRVLLRSMDAGGIIGKGGENIKRLRKKYDCQVQLPDSSGNPERVLTVIGEQNNCVGVFQECLEKVKNEVRRRDFHAPLEIQVLIPQPFMGTIIGTGGTKIKDLRKRSSANIKIFSEPMPYSNERSISLSGTEEQIVSCVSFFLQEIGQREPKEPIILYDPSLPAEMPHYDYSTGHYPPPPHHYGGKRGGRGGRGGRDGHMSHDGRGRGRYSPPPANYPDSGPPDTGISPPSNGPPQSSTNQQDSTVQGLPPPAVVQYPQTSTSQQSLNYQTPPTGGGAPPNTQQYGYYTGTTYPPPPSNVQAPPTSSNLPHMVQQSNPPANQQYQQTPPMAPPTNYPPPQQQQPSSYPSYQTSYGNTSSSTSSGYAAVPTGGYQTNYQPGTYQGQTGYQTGYSSYQQPPQYPTNIPPPTQSNYTGGGQYQQPPAPVFPAGNTMATGYSDQSHQSSKQVTIPNEYAGAILGPNESNLQQIRAQSQCNITMDDPVPGTTQRIITIVGTTANIAVAEQLMKDSVRQHHKV